MGATYTTGAFSASSSQETKRQAITRDRRLGEMSTATAAVQEESSTKTMALNMCCFGEVTSSMVNR